MVNENQGIRVAAYCRVSTEQEDQKNSLRSQRAYFGQMILEHPGWSFVEIYFDEGITGTATKKRTGFNTMIAAAMEGKIDLILTKEVSRFARNTMDVLYYTRKLKEKNVGVLFTLDMIDTRAPDGELRLTIMASLAQEESRKTSERVKWGQLRQMEKGVVFGRDLLGYTVQDGKIRIREEEASIIRVIFRKYLEGKSLARIGRELQAEGMCPKRAKQWNLATLRKILTNEKYVGDLCQRKTYTPDYLTHAKRYNHGEYPFVYLKDHHAPIISRSQWEAVQKEFSKRRQTKR